MHENCRNNLMDHQIRKTSGAIQFKIPHLSNCCIIKKRTKVRRIILPAPVGTLNVTYHTR